MPSTLQYIKRRQKAFAEQQASGAVQSLKDFAVALPNDVLTVTAAGTVDSVDTRRFSATFRVMSRNTDRDGDVIEPKGCLPHLKNYQRNPVVLWDHGQNPEYAMPIAMAEQDGRLYFTVNEDDIISTAFFHEKTQQSSEIGALVMEGVLRGASIGFNPIAATKRMGVRKGLYITEWDPAEWSVCPVGVNAEALRLSFDAGKVKSLSLRSALEPFAAKCKGLVNGATMPKKAIKTKAEKPEDKDEPKPEEKPADEPKEKKEDKPEPTATIGAKRLAESYAHLKALDDHLEKNKGDHEPEANEAHAPLHESLKSLIEDHVKAFDERYPDHDIEKVGAAVAKEKAELDEPKDDKGTTTKSVTGGPRCGKSETTEPMTTANSDAVVKRLCKSCSGMMKDMLAAEDDDTEKADEPTEDKPVETKSETDDDDTEKKSETDKEDDEKKEKSLRSFLKTINGYAGRMESLDKKLTATKR